MSSTLDKQKPQKAQKKERVKNGEYEGHMQD